MFVVALYKHKTLAVVNEDGAGLKLCPWYIQGKIYSLRVGPVEPEEITEKSGTVISFH